MILINFILNQMLLYVWMLFFFVLFCVFFFTLVLLEIYSRAGVQGEGKQHSLSEVTILLLPITARPRGKEALIFI